MNEKKIKIDPHLLTYIYKSLHRYPDNLYDMTKIKQLDCDGYIAPYDFYYEWLYSFCRIWMQRFRQQRAYGICKPLPDVYYAAFGDRKPVLHFVFL